MNDIEEFYSKVRQVAGLNVKAIFVTNSALQSGAIQYATSNKIALVRILPDNQIKWERHFVVGQYTEPKLNSAEFLAAFSNIGYISTRGSFYGRDEKYIYGNLASLLKKAFE